MSVNSLWGQIKLAAGAGILNGLPGFPFAQNVYFVGANAPTFAQRADTIEDAIDLMVSGDVLVLGPQRHEEGNLIIPEGLNNIAIIGAGNRGAAYIEPSGAGDEGLLVLGDDVSLYNVGVACGATGEYALKVGSQTVSPARFRATGCKLEGADAANPAAALVLEGTGDTRIVDCELCWSANGILFGENDNGFATQTLIQNCLFHNLVTVGIGVVTGETLRQVWIVDNVFGRAEDGTAATDDILLSDNANTGFITGNRFSRATNGSGFITIGTGLIYNPNGTEAGWSTARPA